MGSIYKRRDIYYIDFRVNGKRVRKRVGKSKRTAELALKDAELRVERKQFNLDAPDGRLADLWTAYLEYSAAHHHPNTTLRYRQVIDSFRRYLIAKHPTIDRPSQLTLGHFDSFKKWRREVDPRDLDIEIDGRPVPKNALRATPRTINYEVKTLRAVFQFGVTRSVCRSNPTDGISMIKVRQPEPRFLTKEECAKLIQEIDPELKPIVVTFVHTGLRMAELVNLQWQDVDLKRKVLKVRDKENWSTKAGERDIRLNETMLKLFRKLRSVGVSGEVYVFRRPDGQQYTPKLRRRFAAETKRIGLAGVTRLHTLRHTFASHLVMAGVDLPTVQKLMGHSSIETTMIYAHLAPDHLQGAVDKLEF